LLATEWTTVSRAENPARLTSATRRTTSQRTIASKATARLYLPARASSASEIAIISSLFHSRQREKQTQTLAIRHLKIAITLSDVQATARRLSRR